MLFLQNMKRIFSLLFLLLMYSSSDIYAQVLVRGPYMNMNTPTSVVIKWHTDIPTTTQVMFGLQKNNLSNGVADLTLKTSHEVKLTNLSPEKKYYYSVGTNVNVLQGDSMNYFFTAPLTSPTYDKPIRVWAMGDMGKQSMQQIAVKEAYKKFIDTTPVHGWILLGDNAYPNGTDMEYQMGFFNYYQNDVTRNTVIWPCLGNHDYANDYNRRVDHMIPYTDIFTLPQNGDMGGIASNNERYYSFNYGNVHFVNLDSYGLENVSGTQYGLADTAFSPQVFWLKNDLQNNTLPWVVVSFHHPPYCMGSHNSDIENDLVTIRSNLNPILERYNVDLVLSGHCHTYQRSMFIKNHFGLEPTFDSAMHVRQQTSGKYDSTGNSCFFVKNKYTASDSGTIYMVIGSGGAVPYPPFAAWPHNAMYYSNWEQNGSLLLTIEGNQLKSQWISTDTGAVVKDEFYMLKNANTKRYIYTTFPAWVPVKATWTQPPFLWSTGDTIRTIMIYATGDTLFTVQDKKSCITDTIIITSPLAVSDEKNTNALNDYIIYPNPNKGNFYLQLPQKDFYYVYVTNIKGQVVFQKNIPYIDKAIFLDLKSVLPPSSYMINIIDTHNNRSNKQIYIEQ